MLSAKDIMSADPVTIAPDMDIIEATKLLLEHKFNGLPVVDHNGKLVGVLCQSDLVAQQKKVNLPSLFTILDGFIPLKSLSDVDSEMRKVAATRVADAMTEEPVTVSPDTPLDEVATLMVDSKYYTLPVVQDGRLVGVVGKEDVLRTLVGA
ncbi:CBS domain-containing protein [Oleidesulfovibrio sp.]|uniref:CBS domain-containing protein n=1 Tax=Oleidesulfovibrio sp. TaxID=2909707 RepID=UPI003A86881E